MKIKSTFVCLIGMLLNSCETFYLEEGYELGLQLPSLNKNDFYFHTDVKSVYDISPVDQQWTFSITANNVSWELNGDIPEWMTMTSSHKDTSGWGYCFPEDEFIITFSPNTTPYKRTTELSLVSTTNGFPYKKTIRIEQQSFGQYYAYFDDEKFIYSSIAFPCHRDWFDVIPAAGKSYEFNVKTNCPNEIEFNCYDDFDWTWNMNDDIQWGNRYDNEIHCTYDKEKGLLYLTVSANISN